MELEVYKILNKTKAEGPGERFCIWVQGCSRRCEGCWAKATWEKGAGEKIKINKLFEMICAEPDIEGVTFLGGEPFEQAKALAKLAEKIRKRGLSVLTFTGNTYEELQTRNDSHVNKLIENTDLLVDGAFEKDKFTTERPWVGSENQRYLFLTDRYCEKDITISKNKIEIRVDKKGLVFVNGMGDFNKIKNDIICV